MGWRWYIYNKSLDQYYYTGSSDLSNIQSYLKYLFNKHNWTLDQSLHFVSDQDMLIDESKVVK